MKTVDLTTDMRPWREGDAVHLPDKVAQQLIDSGEAKNMRPFNPSGTEQPQVVERPRGTYQTKGRKG